MLQHKPILHYFYIRDIQ